MSKKIKLVAPAEAWDKAVEIDEETAKIIKDMCDRIGVRTNEKDGKLYVTDQRKAITNPPKPVNGVRYPSGFILPRHPQNNVLKYAPGNPSTASPLVKGKLDTKLSDHFTLGEFFPKSSEYDGVRVHPDLVEMLEKIRRKTGKLTITSGYRPPAYNRSVGGVSNSQHLDGLAADIYSDDISIQKLYDIVDTLVGHSGGVGFYLRHGFVHVDVRGYRARWMG